MTTTTHHTDPNTPEPFLTRCHCGSKYWDGLTCHSCKETFKPWLYEWDAEEGHTLKESF